VKVLLDTDILLDVALRRAEFFADSAAVIAWAEANPGDAAVAWHSLSNLIYMVRPDGRAFIRELLEFVDVAPVDTDGMRMALGFPMKDLEDAMQAASALAFGARHIITRNLPDYRQSPVPALKPAAFRKLIEASED
jgi:predicted nucleic acid-binding protein